MELTAFELFSVFEFVVYTLSVWTQLDSRDAEEVFGTTHLVTNVVTDKMATL